MGKMGATTKIKIVDLPKSKRRPRKTPKSPTISPPQEQPEPPSKKLKIEEQPETSPITKDQEEPVIVTKEEISSPTPPNPEKSASEIRDLLTSELAKLREELAEIKSSQQQKPQRKKKNISFKLDETPANESNIIDDSNLSGISSGPSQPRSVEKPAPAPPQSSSFSYQKKKYPSFAPGTDSSRKKSMTREEQMYNMILGKTTRF